MSQEVEKVPAEKRWAIATRALTGMVVTLEKALRDALGQEGYNEVMGRFGAEQGKAAKQVADALGLAGDDAKSAAETSRLVCIVAMGSEVKGEIVEATPERVVIRYTECPWLNRQQELGISDDLCSVSSPAFAKAFAKSLNPKLTVTQTKAMPKGDPYCEEVWELQK